MLNTLRGQMTLTILAVLLLTVALIGCFSYWYITHTFENYISRQGRERSESIVVDLENRYETASGGWSADFLHMLGMYSLYDGYILRVTDVGGKVIWDAENHDMALCGQIMGEISARMGDKSGGFEKHNYKIMYDGQLVGAASITYYGPFFYTENDYLFIKTLNGATIVISLLSVVLAFIVGNLLARRISGPVTSTANAAGQIAHGNYNVAFENTSNIQELKEMVSAVTELVISLREQENLRKRLTSDVAHELRTPLAAVASHLEAMIDGVWEPTPDRLESCREEVVRIASLVKDLQQLARIDSENLKLDKTGTDLRELTQSVARTFEAVSVKKDLSVSVDGTSSVVRADKDRLSQVITNLISNAIKYTPEHGSISATITDTENAGIIKICDNGIGIAPEELPFIFERFYRTDKSRDRKTGGAGVGLTIAKSIVEAHGGTIDVSSKLGAGSQFVVTLPKV
ncbi:MAG: HAMP domain-containing histidine kinase [Clostridiales bacterium]|jgi:signal transduction histidine kinase|nr:HAMP domain-containing histidine kinase [Clostridiales bacterium]